jgi:ribosomal protein S18 acetylase RimI-like enzyme
MTADVFTIRRADISDLDTVLRISTEAYIPAYREAGYIPRPAREDYSPRIDEGEVWLIESTNGPAGVTILQTMPDHLLVYSIAVLPAFQRQGYGRALLDFADRRAIEIDAKELRLHTNQRMIQNLRLYQACGYREIGRRPHPGYPGEILVDMAKQPGACCGP